MAVTLQPKAVMMSRYENESISGLIAGVSVITGMSALMAIENITVIKNPYLFRRLFLSYQFI